MKCIVIFYNIVLLLSHLTAQWQAFLLSYLLIENKGSEYNFQKDLGLTDFQVSIVVGSVFTFTNGFANLFFGALADIYPRKWLWVITCILWSLCTFAESYAETFT